MRDVGDEAFDQPTLKADNMIVDLLDDAGNPRRAVQSPYKFSNATSGIDQSTRAPMRGEHNAEALKDWLGWSQDQVETLAAEGILRSDEEAAGG